MVHCEHCGKTDGCSFQDFHGTTLCIRCYRAARDREYEERKKQGPVKAEDATLHEAPPEKSQIRRFIDQFFKREA